MSSVKRILWHLVIVWLAVVPVMGCGDEGVSSGREQVGPAPVTSADEAVRCLSGSGAYVESLDVPPEEGPRAPYRELRVRMPRGTIAFVGYYERDSDARYAARLAREGGRGVVIDRARVVAVFQGSEENALRRCIAV